MSVPRHMAVAIRWAVICAAALAGRWSPAASPPGSGASPPIPAPALPPFAPAMSHIPAGDDHPFRSDDPPPIIADRADALFEHDLVIPDGATQQFRLAGQAATLRGRVSGEGTLHVVGPGKLTMEAYCSGVRVVVVEEAGLTIRAPSGVGRMVRAERGILRCNAAMTIRADIGIRGSLAVDTGPYDVTLSGAVSGSADGVAKHGTGLLRLTGDNTHRTGGLVIHAGTVAIRAAAALGHATNPLIFQGDGTTAAVRLLCGNAEAVTLTGPVRFHSDGAIECADRPVTLTGAMEGGGGLRKTGPGELKLAGPVTTWTGSLHILEGMIRMGDKGELNRVGDVVLADAPGVVLDLERRHVQMGPLSGGGPSGGDIRLGPHDLEIVQMRDTTFAGRITGPVPEGVPQNVKLPELIKRGTGTLRLAGALRFGGRLNLQEGAIAVPVAGVLPSRAALALGGNGTLELTGAGAHPIPRLEGAAHLFVGRDATLALGGDGGSTEYWGEISGPGGITIRKGEHPTVLSGERSTFTGPTRVIDDGFLIIRATAGRKGDGTPQKSGALSPQSRVFLQRSHVAIHDERRETVPGLEGDGEIKLAAGTRFTIAGAEDSLYHGSFSGAGTLAIAGPGTFVGAGEWQHTGPTVVTGGTLQLRGAALTETALTVSGGTLRGQGLIKRPATVGAGARLIAGDPPMPRRDGSPPAGAAAHVLLIQGGLTLQPGAVFEVRLGAEHRSTEGVRRERGHALLPAPLHVDNNAPVNLDGAVLELRPQERPVSGALYALIRNERSGLISGTFAGLPQGGVFLADGVRWQISYTGDGRQSSFTGGGDVVLRCLGPESGVSCLAVVAVVLIAAILLVAMLILLRKAGRRRPVAVPS